MKFLLTMYFILLTCSCTPPASEKTTGTRRASGTISNAGGTPNDGTLSNTSTKTTAKKKQEGAEQKSPDGGIETADPNAPKLMDPLTAAGTISPKIALAPSDIVSDPTKMFPQISIKNVNADFFQIIRCVGSYNLVSNLGNNPRTVTGLSAEEKKWAWSGAIGANKSCKIVSMYLTASPYIDMPAESGTFYYVANPCVSAARSSTGQEACSFNLSFTEPLVDYKNLFKEDVRRLAEDLATAQSALYADLDDVRLTARLLEIRLNLCENYFAFNETQKSLKSGIIELGLMIAGAIVGGTVSKLVKPIGSLLGGASGGAMMGGMLAQSMGGAVIEEMLNLGPGFNSCLYGEEAVAQQGLTKEKDIQRARVAAQDYESTFNVKETLDHLAELVQVVDQAHPQGGKIAKDMARMQAVMTEMNKIDQTVISVNAFVAQGKEYVAGQMSQLAIGKKSPATTSP